MKNAHNYVNRNEFFGFKNDFTEFKESINDRFDRLERSIWALRRGNFKPNKSKNSKKRSENNGGEDGEKEKDEGK